MTPRTLDIAAALIHGAQAIAVAVILSTLPPVLAPITAKFGDDVQIAEVNLGTAAVIVLAFSAIMRALSATGRWQRVLRWVEYSQVSAVSLFLVAQLNGIRDIAALVPLYAITAGVVFFLVLHERTASRMPYVFGVMLGIVPWGVIAFYQIGSTLVEGGPAVLVRVVTLGLLVVAALHWWLTLRWPQRAHLTVLIGNAFLAWTIVIGAMPQTYP